MKDYSPGKKRDRIRKIQRSRNIIGTYVTKDDLRVPTGSTSLMESEKPKKKPAKKKK
jgi:hypothetical protein|tara:strand:- start:824 stop:994 length:171 start_codon:yes stop_codon:yes gene_type:complete